MIRRQAAALLCGAAAVHLADLAFYAGQATGVSWGLVLLAAVIPAALFTWAAWDSSVGPWVFLLGACGGYFSDEWLLLPRLGWGWTTLGWIALWASARFPRPRTNPDSVVTRGMVALAGALVLGAAAGFSIALIRPFLFQHVTGTRHGLRIAVMTGLVGLATGAALGHALKPRMPRTGVTVLGAVFATLGAVTAFVLLPRASSGLSMPMFSGPWSFTWWGRSLLASWAMLGLLSVGFGILLVLLNRRLAVVAVVAGLAAGSRSGETVVLDFGQEPTRARAIADQVARHPPPTRIEAAEIGPDGIWTRYRTRTLLEIEPIWFWQATRLGRGMLWKNLEAAEIEPWPDPSPWPWRSGVLEHPHGVWSSFGYLASGFTLRDTVGSLRAAGEWAQQRPSGETRSFRDWCDPRALTPAGLRSLLATWREALPEATFSVLVDGYSGPLLGLRLGARRFPIADQLTIFEAKASAAFRGELGPVSTTLRPVLEWETAPEPSPFIHPRAEVMRALVEAMAIEPGSAIDHLFRGLVIHAEAQVVRPYVVSAWDHVAVPEAEVREYMVALQRDDHSARVIQHLQIVFEVLSKKREYAMLVRHLEEAVARRPDVFAFHRTLGKTYADILKFPDAVEELTQARALQPDHHDVSIELSRALGGAKRWPEAVVVLEAELRRHDEPEVRKGLAIALTEAGELDRARAMIRELAASYPADVDIMRAQDRLSRAESR